MIDRDVAEYWRENFDLTNILRRDWETLWPKLRGKLHIFVGDMDTFYLNKSETPDHLLLERTDLLMRGLLEVVRCTCSRSC